MDNSLEAIVLVSVGLSLLCAVGVIDDAYNIPAGWKLLSQVVAALPIIVAGCVIPAVSIGGLQIPLGPLGSLAALAWLVACTNAVNLIDGMDGLCSTVGLCVAAGVTGVAYLSGAGNTMVCAAATAGAIGGFLLHNLPPARIYLGDAGSMVIGMTLALLTLRAAQNEHGATNLTILAALMAVPLGDVALAMVRRKLSGRAIFAGDRGHIHHRLLDHGLRVPQVLASIAAIGITTSLIAVGTLFSGSDLFGVLALALVAFVLISRQLVGHYEWSLFQTILNRRTKAAETFAAPRLLRINGDEPTILRLHAEVEVIEATDKLRAA